MFNSWDRKPRFRLFFSGFAAGPPFVQSIRNATPFFPPLPPSEYRGVGGGERHTAAVERDRAEITVTSIGSPTHNGAI